MPDYVKSAAAQIDLIEIWSFASQKSFRSADLLLDRLEETFVSIAEQPLMGRAREELAPGLRSIPVGNYLIFYRSKDGLLEIVRVLHAARDIESLFDEP